MMIVVLLVVPVDPIGRFVCAVRSRAFNKAALLKLLCSRNGLVTEILYPPESQQR